MVDELVADRGEDHQEPPGTDFAARLRDVITKMRAAFPDLHFEVHRRGRAVDPQPYLRGKLR